MHHRLDDLILEAVENSRDSQAKAISIEVESRLGRVEVKVVDDGVSPIPENPFGYGVSTKGDDRGRGLALIKERDRSASLDRCNGMTVLAFASEDDGSLEDLEHALLPVFLGEGKIEFSWRRGDRVFHLSSKELERENAFPSNGGSIARFKAIVKQKRSTLMSKLSLDDLRAIRNREEKELRKRDIHGRTVHVVVGMGTSGINAGAKVVLNALADEIEAAGLDKVILTQTGSLAPIAEPVVEVYSPESGLVVYADVSKADAERIVKEHLVSGKILEDKRVEVKED